MKKEMPYILSFFFSPSPPHIDGSTTISDGLLVPLSPSFLIERTIFEVVPPPPLLTLGLKPACHRPVRKTPLFSQSLSPHTSPFLKLKSRRVPRSQKGPLHSPLYPTRAKSTGTDEIFSNGCVLSINIKTDPFPPFRPFPLRLTGESSLSGPNQVLFTRLFVVTKGLTVFPSFPPPDLLRKGIGPSAWKRTFS